MSGELVEFLSSKGLNRQVVDSDGEPTSVIQKLNDSQIIDITTHISELLPRQKRYSPSPFMFVANTSLSGGPHPCSAPSCRIRAVDDLGRFAALYADHVFLPDPFEALTGSARFMNNEVLRREFATYLEIIRILKPLLAANLASFIENKHVQVCSSCFPRAMTKISPAKEPVIRKMIGNLKRVFEKEVSFSIVEVTLERIIIRIRGPEKLLPHGGNYFYMMQPEGTPLLPELINNVSEEKSIPVPEDLMELLGLVRGEIEETVYDLQRQDSIARQKSVGYLTNREIDFDLLQLYTGQKKKKSTKPNMTPNLFSHIVPTVQETSLKKLVKFREQEEPAFQVYRQSVSAALSKATSDNYTTKILEEIYNDQIRSEIINLENTIRKSRKLLVQSLVHDIGIAAGAISIGALVPYLPSAASAALGTLSGAFYAKRAFTNVINAIGEPKEVINNRYYFLWKLTRNLK